MAGTHKAIPSEVELRAVEALLGMALERLGVVGRAVGEVADSDDGTAAPVTLDEVGRLLVFAEAARTQVELIGTRVEALAERAHDLGAAARPLDTVRGARGELVREWVALYA